MGSTGRGRRGQNLDWCEKDEREHREGEKHLGEWSFSDPTLKDEELAGTTDVED